MRRALVAALAAVSLPAAAAIAGCGSAGGQHSSGASAPPSVINRAQAQQVLSQYTAATNRANKLRDPSFLATFEAGSSYQLDQGYYRWTKSTDPANHAYSPVSYRSPEFYIPQQPHYPAWFVVRAWQQYQKKTKPAAGTSPHNGYIYLLFTRASSTAKWMLAREPLVLSGGGSPPQVATGAGGYAQTVTAADAQRLAIAPSKLPSQDVSYLNYGTYQQMNNQLARTRGLKPRSQPKPVAFANGTTSLADVHDEAFWKKSMPRGSSQSDFHATTSDPVYALRTTDGGALVFYDLTADLTLGAPYGGMMGLMTVHVPGFLSGKEKPQASFGINYGEQFAVYEPPGKPASPEVVADDSDPVSAECGGGPCKQ